MKQNKKGFTLAECVVAIAVILIVTTSAIVIFQTATRATSRQWDKYRVTLEANNVLAAFQGAEDMDCFSNLLGLTEATAEGEVEEDEGVVITELPSVDYKVCERMVQKPITEIRCLGAPTYAVRFYNSGTMLAEFTYATEEEYLAAVAFLDVKADAEGTQETTNPLKKKSVADLTGSTDAKMKFVLGGTGVTYSQINNSNLIEIYRTTDTDNVWVKYGATGLGSGKDKNGNLLGQQATFFEEYLLSKGYALVPIAYNTATKTMQFRAYSTATGDSVNEIKVYRDDKEYYLDFFVQGEWEIYGSGAIRNESNIITNRSLTVTGLQYAEVDANGALSSLGKQHFVDANGTDYSDYEWGWYYFPTFAYDAWKKSTLGNVSYSKGGYQPTNQYTSYRVKDSSLSNITYALYKEGEIRIFANPTGATITSANQSDMLELFQYTGSKDQYNAALDGLKNSCGWTTYQYAVETENTDGTVETKLFDVEIEGYKVLGDVRADRKLASVYANDNEKTITFYDTKSVAVLVFTYTDAEIYEEDKAQIYGEDGDFADCYTVDAQGKCCLLNDYQNTPVLSLPTTQNNWHLSTIDAQNHKNEIFIGHADVKQMGASQLVGKEGQVTQKVKYNTVTQYFYKTYGDYTCYIEAIYAAAVGTSTSKLSNKNSVEPRLYIWILNDEEVAKVEKWGVESLPQIKDYYISYRKG